MKSWSDRKSLSWPVCCIWCEWMERGRSPEVTKGCLVFWICVCVGVYNIEMWNIAGTVLAVTVISAVRFFSDWNLTDLAIYTKERIVLWCYITSTQYAHWLKHLKRCRLNAFINQVVIHSYIHTIQSVPFCFFLQNQNQMLNLLYSLNVHKHTNHLLWFTVAYI